MKKQKYPVLIVGGGLVGLSTALFLSHHNIAYYLIRAASWNIYSSQSTRDQYTVDGIVSPFSD